MKFNFVHQTVPRREARVGGARDYYRIWHQGFCRKKKIYGPLGRNRRDYPSHQIAGFIHVGTRRYI